MVSVPFYVVAIVAVLAFAAGLFIGWDRGGYRPQGDRGAPSGAPPHQGTSGTLGWSYKKP